MTIAPKFFIASLVFVSTFLNAQHTFSIVAVDEETGEIGSAGASCVVGAADLGGVIIISDIIPGRGAINGQATICIPHINLSNGINQMQSGLAPQEVLDWLYDNDACQFGNNENRQYGVVDFDEEGMARSAAFTGANALDYAGQRIGANYAIQGNILLGPQILDAMEQAFLSTEGSLAEKLMAALQGANVPGADSRCLTDGTSSTSGYLQVYRPDDAPNAPYLRINVMETETGTEPIDSIQVLFDAFQLASSVEEFSSTDLTVFPNPSADYFIIRAERESIALELIIYAMDGRLLHQQAINSSMTRVNTDFINESGVVYYQLVNAANEVEQRGSLVIDK